MQRVDRVADVRPKMARLHGLIAVAAVLVASSAVAFAISSGTTTLAVGMTIALVAGAILFRRENPVQDLLLLVAPSLAIPVDMSVAWGERQMVFGIPDILIAMALLLGLPRLRSPIPKWRDLNIALIVWGVATVAASADMGKSLVSLRVLVEACIVGVLWVSATHSHAKHAYIAMMKSICILAVLIGVQMLAAGRLASVGLGSSDVDTVQAMALAHNSDFRVSQLLGRSNYTATFLVLGLSAALVLWHLRISRAQTYVYLLMALFSLVSIVLTGSRTQLASAGCVILSALVMRGAAGEGQRRTVARRLGLIMGLVFGVALMWTVVSATYAPVAASGVTDYSSFSARVELWREAWKEIAGSPILGHGIGMLDLSGATGGTASMAHDAILQFLGEMGIVGALLFVAICAFPWVAVRSSRMPSFFTLPLLAIGLCSIAEPTFRTGAYDYVAWLCMASIVALMASTPKIALVSNEVHLRTHL